MEYKIIWNALVDWLIGLLGKGITTICVKSPPASLLANCAEIGSDNHDYQKKGQTLTLYFPFPYEGKVASTYRRSGFRRSVDPAFDGA